jgi:hypothetical protein
LRLQCPYAAKGSQGSAGMWYAQPFPAASQVKRAT